MDLLWLFLLFGVSSFFLWLVIKKNKFLEVFLAIFSLANAAVLTGMVNFFSPIIVLIVSLLFFGALWRRFKKPQLIQVSIDKKDFLVILVLLAVCLSFQYRDSYTGGQDAVTGFLPLSRYLAERQGFPRQWYSLSDYDLATFRVGSPPLIVGLAGFLFQATGIPSEKIASSLPTLFFCLFLLILFQYGKDRGINIFWIFLLVLLSVYLMAYFSFFIQEAPLAFFCGLTFYNLYKFIKTKEISFFNFAILASGLASLTKISGLGMPIFVIFFGLFYRLWKPKKVVLFLLAHLVPLSWYLRNYFLFGALYPAGPAGGYIPVLNPDAKPIELVYRFRFMTSRTLSELWARIGNAYFLAPIFFFWLIGAPIGWKKLDNFDRTVYGFHFLSIIIWIWFLTVLDVRHLILFLLPALVQLGSLVKKKSRSRENFGQANSQSFPMRRRALTTPTLDILLFLTLGLALIASNVVFRFDNAGAHRRAVSFLREKEGIVPGTRVFMDTDMGFTWFGRMRVFLFGELWSDEFLRAVAKNNVSNFLENYNIRYVVNEWLYIPGEERIFVAFDHDKENFEKIYDRDGIIIWKRKGRID